MKLAAYLTLVLALGLGLAWFSEFNMGASDRMFPDLAQRHDESAEKYGLGAVVALIASIVLFAKSGTPTSSASTQSAGEYSSAVDGLSKKCPDCAEIIKSEAIVCRFCGYRFQPVEVQASPARETCAPDPAT